MAALPLCSSDCCPMPYGVPRSLWGFILCAILFCAHASVAPVSVKKIIPTYPAPPESSFGLAPNPDKQRLYLRETPHRTYYVTVGIGTPQQYLRLLLHTGIADMWIHECTSIYSIECLTYPAYNPAHSSTVKLERHMKKYTTRFYPQTLLYGNLEKDFVRMGTTSISDQSFCVYEDVYFEHSMPTSFTHLDGFLGLGAPEGSVLPESPFFVRLQDRAVLPEPQASIFLYGALGGELILGGADPKHNASAHKWVHIMNDRGAWSMQIEDIYMFDVVRTCSSWCRAIINTGFPHIAGPAKDIQKINKFLKSFGEGDDSHREQSCEDRILDIAREFSGLRNEISNLEMCLSSGLCEKEHFAYMTSLSIQELLQRNVTDFQYDFGCAVCLSIADGVEENEDYDPEIATKLCNWIDDLEQKALEEHDSEELDCNSMQSFKLLRLRMNDKFLFVDPAHYVYKRIHKNLFITCHTEFVEYKESGGQQWILGTSFLRAFHTIIDFEHELIGFAKPARS